MNHHVDLELRLEIHNWLFPRSTPGLYKMIITHVLTELFLSMWKYLLNKLHVCVWMKVRDEVKHSNTSDHDSLNSPQQSKTFHRLISRHQNPHLSANMSCRWMKCVSGWFLTSETLLISCNTFYHSHERLCATCTHVTHEWLNDPQKCGK